MASTLVRSSRLTLVPMTTPDLEAIASGRRDIGGGQLSDAARRWIEASVALHPREGGAWTIRRRLTRRLLGCVMYFTEDGREPEISYMILPQWRRRRFGSEAVAVATAHLVGELGHETVTAHVALDNAASISLLSGLGFLRHPTDEDLRVGLDRRPAERWAWTKHDTGLRLAPEPRSDAADVRDLPAAADAGG